jgi:hypothetical protein
MRRVEAVYKCEVNIHFDNRRHNQDKSRNKAKSTNSGFADAYEVEINALRDKDSKVIRKGK